MENFNTSLIETIIKNKKSSRTAKNIKYSDNKFNSEINDLWSLHSMHRANASSSSTHGAFKN